jgi:hypothetical protein
MALWGSCARAAPRACFRTSSAESLDSRASSHVSRNHHSAGSAAPTRARLWCSIGTSNFRPLCATRTGVPPAARSATQASSRGATSLPKRRAQPLYVTSCSRFVRALYLYEWARIVYAHACALKAKPCANETSAHKHMNLVSSHMSKPYLSQGSGALQ